MEKTDSQDEQSGYNEWLSNGIIRMDFRLHFTAFLLIPPNITLLLMNTPLLPWFLAGGLLKLVYPYSLHRQQPCGTSEVS